MGAVAVLQSALEQIDDDRELKSKIAEYRSQYISLTIEEYVATGDYGSAIELLNENEDFVNGDTNLQIRRSELIAKYKEKLFADAEQLYENEGYKCAIILLKDGLKVAGTSDAEILDKISFYNNLAPVNLSSLSPFNQDASSWGHIETHDDVVDNMGNTYRYAMTSVYSGGNLGWTIWNWNEYSIGKKYSRLTGTMFVTSNAPGNDYGRGDFRLIISGDGKELYSAHILRGEKPIGIDVDIRGVEDITIEIYGGTFAYLGNPLLYP